MMQLHPTDFLGYAASAAVLATFALREMRVLRLMAISSNVLFMCYAHRSGLGPVLLLHSMLLPLNVLRLYQAAQTSASTPAARRRTSRCTRPRRVAARCSVDASAVGVKAQALPREPVARSDAAGLPSPPVASCRS